MRASSRRAERHEEEEESAFVSMTDMTVSFLFIVMILLAFFASQLHNKDTVPKSAYEEVVGSAMLPKRKRRISSSTSTN